MIAVVDYGVGNLFSLEQSFRAIGADVTVTADPEVLRKADKILLPGVGAFGDAAEKLLYKAIATLPDKQRLVFNMRYFDEMPYAQMSEIVGTSEGALKASYHLAVKKVEQYILDHR